MTEIAENTIGLVSEIQKFDPQRLVRAGDLGRDMAFTNAVDVAQKIVRLFQQIPTDYLKDLPEENIRRVQHWTNETLNNFRSILDFSVADINNPLERRNALIDSLRGTFNSAFTDLYPLVAYLGTRERDISVMESELRGVIDVARSEVQGLKETLSEDRNEAQKIVSEIRSAAAEQGVGFEAVHFKNEADSHKAEADRWQGYTVKMAAGLSIYTVILFFAAIMPGLIPNDPYQAVQLIISKALLFAVLAYMLIFCVKNVMAHRHNFIVNTHRQNALLTYQAMSNAIHGEAQRDIVVMNAASCIYSPQETGYMKGQSNQFGSSQLIEILPKIANGGSVGVA